MAIILQEADGIFHLRSDVTSYIIKRYPSGLVGNLYWGARLDDGDLSDLVYLRDRRAMNINAANAVSDYDDMQDLLYAEYPSHGTSDFRAPAFQVRQADGSTVSNLYYKTHRVLSGKPALENLPHLWCRDDNEADTLVLELEDTLTGLVVELSYTIFTGTGALVRSAKFTNRGAAAVTLYRALSASIDLTPEEFDFLHLDGSWARERHVVRDTLRGGAHQIESTRGFSSHQYNPFAALVSPDCGEEYGRVYAFNLVYSGNFLAQAERDQYGGVRFLMGIHPLEFNWRLVSGESFQTPECVMVFSDAGLGAMSRTFHKLYRAHLLPQKWARKERPILVNNWEATYFNFNAEKILSLARTGAELGIELLVLDDGWFGHRDSDNSSLGDWFPDTRKLPGGIKALAEGVEKTGLSFGLWFEPEMISRDSELYKAHPDWCLHVEGRRRTEIRNQLVLDLTRADVRDAVVNMITEVLRGAPISYVKWDMNRPLTELGSAKLPPERQGEVAHRYVLGVYDIMRRITGAFPDVLFEGCAGGGSRFDPGILFFMPQIWTSDNSDAVERLKIQWGTSLAYPLSVMGAHVSAVPNHQTGRVTPLATRGNVAAFGIFGYELDLGKLTGAEKEAVTRQVALCKQHRGLILDGNLYRLKSPFARVSGGSGNETAWIVVAQDKSRALAMYARTLSVPNPPLSVLRLAGLDGDADYDIEGPHSYTAHGSLLMRAGIRIPAFWGDFQSCVWVLTKRGA